MSALPVITYAQTLSTKAALTANIRSLLDLFTGFGLEITPQFDHSSSKKEYFMVLVFTRTMRNEEKDQNFVRERVAQALRDAGYTESIYGHHTVFSLRGLHVEFEGLVVAYDVPDLLIRFSEKEFPNNGISEMRHAIPESLRGMRITHFPKNETLVPFDPSSLDVDFIIRGVAEVLTSNTYLQQICSPGGVVNTTYQDERHSPFYGPKLRTSRLLIVMRTIFAERGNRLYDDNIPYKGCDSLKFDLLLHAFKREMTSYMPEQYFLNVCKFLESQDFSDLTTFREPEDTYNVQTAWDVYKPFSELFDYPDSSQVRVPRSAAADIARGLACNSLTYCQLLERDEPSSLEFAKVRRAMMTAIYAFMMRLLHGAPVELYMDYFPGLRTALHPPQIGDTPEEED